MRISGFNQRPQNGFSLIVSIALMSFLLLLFLSLASLLQVEATAALQESHRSTARQNALLGLNVALGQLQNLAGPDTRITAPADIAGAANGKLAWTGVWNSKSSGGTADEFRGWLVSLKDTDAAQLDSATADDIPWQSANGQWEADDDWVVLVGDGSVETGSEPDNYIAAQSLPVEASSGQRGNYAFWVGEENTKARINLPVPNSDDLADDTDVGSLLSPRYSGFPQIDVAAFSGLEADDPRLQRLSGMEELASFSNDQGVGQRYFHDLSTYGQGVLSNLQSGGLKQDLTHLFEHDTAFQRQFGSAWQEDFIFIPPEATIDFNYGSPNWGILRSYYQLPDSITGGSIAPIAVDDDERKTKTFSTYQSTNEGYQINQPVHALFSLIRLVVAVEYRVDNSDETSIDYYPRLHLKPLVALYNPYDIPLQATSYYVDWSFNPRVTIQISGQEAVSFRIQEVIPPPSNANSNTRFNWRINTDTDLQPGETRYYALNATTYIGDSSTTGTMQADWNESGSYYIDLTRDSNVVAASSDGSTSLLQSADSEDAATNTKSPAFGLTSDEKTALEFTTLKTNAFRPGITIDVSYDPRNNADNSSGTSRDLWLKVGGSQSTYTSTYGGALFQEFEEDMCPDDTSATYVSIDDVTGSIVDVSGIGFGLRTTTDTEDAQRQLIDGNPRAILLSNWDDGFRGGRGNNALSGWAVYEYTLNEFDLEINDLDRYSGYWGQSRVLGGTGSVVLFHVPREPLVSLGQFEHATIGRYARHPAYVIGNSYAVARIPTDSTAAEGFYTEGGRTHSAYDWSYVINEQLWDDYYFSTVPQNLTPTELSEYTHRERSLPNPRLSFYEPTGLELTTDILTDEAATDTARTVAAMQTVEGPFNVNSTSVAAWKAFLASNTDLTIPIYDPATGLVSSESEESETVFFRTPVSYDNGFETTDNNSAFWNAYRKLDDDEMTSLAEAVVSEVKARGPFSSVADFVNRRLSGTAEQRRRGALQAALDTSINAHVSTGLVGSASGSDLSIPNYSGDTLNTEDRPGMGMPGWILQGDVLQTLGPLLTARSDTFRIRAYGDTLNPVTDEVIARAWCEAIVQRLPDFVDTNDLPQTPIYAEDNSLNVSSINETFGRQFRVLSFRWLNPEEI